MPYGEHVTPFHLPDRPCLLTKHNAFLENFDLVALSKSFQRRMIQTAISNLRARQKSQTEHILLVNPSLHSVAEVNEYQEELTKALANLGIDDSYYAWHLCTTYGKKANKILERSAFYRSGTMIQRLVRAELWYCIQFEMTNSLADFFVRRTGRLYFNINSISEHLDIVLKDCISILEWDEKRVAQEKALLHQLLSDATTYYDKEF